MKIFIFSVLTVFLQGSAMGSRDTYGCPSFKWLKDYHSDYEIPLLNIKFPDEQEDDFAVLRKVQGGSSTDEGCILKGHLMIQKNVSVTVSKGCDLQNSFEIEFDSHRLVYSAFTVKDGLVKPVLQESSDEVQSLRQEYSNGTINQQPPKFPIHGFVLRVKAFYDSSFQSKFDVLSKPVVETIFEKAQRLFTLPSLTTNITLDLVDVVAINSSNISLYLNTTEMGQLSADGDGNNINALVFFTGNSDGKLKTVTNVGKVCSSNPQERVAIVEWRKTLVETSKTLAREIGHLIGMHQDFNWNPNRTKIHIRRSSNNKKCTSGNGIMDYNSDHSVWSACSVEDFLKYFKTATQIGARFCLKEQPTGPVKTSADYTKVAVAFGVTSSYVYLGSAEVIDISSSNTRCQNLQNFPDNFFGGVGGLGFGDNPIICGKDENSSSCHSLQNGSWKPDASLNEVKYASAMTRSPFPNDVSKLFVTGGQDESSFEPLKSAEVLTENGWQLSTPLPVEISYHCMVMINSTSVMVIGGFQGKSDQISGKTFLLDGVTKVWREGPELKHERSAHSCAMIKKDSQSQDKSVVVVGGKDDGGELISTEVFDVGSSKWRSGPELPFGISYAAMVEDPSGGVVLIGGYNSGRIKPLDTLFRLPHAGSGATWEKMPQKLKTERRYHTAFLIPDEHANCN